LDSLAAQTDSGWTLTVVEPEPWSGASRRLAGRRVTIVTSPEGAGPGDLLRLGLPAEEDDAVVLIFPGDVWAPGAVARLRAALRARGVAYADQDRVDAEGQHVSPELKPDYSPDFLLTSAYVGRPLAFRAGLLRGVQFNATNLSELEHECALAVCEAAESVVHVPEVLCHRTGDPPTPVHDVAYVQAALERRHDLSAVQPGPAPGTFRIVRTAPSRTSVSVIIPFRDQPRFLRTCVESVRATAGDADVEIILVDNGSSEPETATLLDALSAGAEVHVLTDERPFNWAELNNAAARQARGDVLVFLNNDIEAHRDGWLRALCAQALRPDVGAVGARLLYPDRQLQHCGIVVGLTGAAGHPLAGLSPTADGYLHMATVTRECSAVTGACLASRREVFESLDGFDETLGVDLNDVDYCLRARQLGYRVLFEPGAELIHYESPSRGTAGGVGDIVNFVARWKSYIDARDPYLNPHLTRDDPSCALARPQEKEAWSRWHSTLIAR
jgi:GT2 family glycosyltransferase